MLAFEIKASSLSDLKLYNVDKLEPRETIPSSFSEVELFKDDILVPKDWPDSEMYTELLEA